MADGGTSFVWRPTARDRLVARAQNTANAAVKRGLLAEVETLRCMDCGEPAECYDHRNYYHPLAVDPVCKGCNNRRGPGFPPLQEGDGGAYRNELGHKAGYRWTGLQGGEEGFAPEICPVHLELNWCSLEELADIGTEIIANERAHRARERLRRMTNQSFKTGEKKTTKHFQKGSRLVLGVPGSGRYEYFKARDPWSLS